MVVSASEAKFTSKVAIKEEAPALAATSIEDNKDSKVSLLPTEGVKQPDSDPSVSQELAPLSPECSVQLSETLRTSAVKAAPITEEQKPAVRAGQPTVETAMKSKSEIEQKSAVETAKKPTVETVKKPAVETVKKPAVETVKKPAVETVKKPSLETTKNPNTLVTKTSSFSPAEKPLAESSPIAPRRSPRQSRAAKPSGDVPASPKPRSASSFPGSRTKPEEATPKVGRKPRAASSVRASRSSLAKLEKKKPEGTGQSVVAYLLSPCFTCFRVRESD